MYKIVKGILIFIYGFFFAYSQIRVKCGLWFNATPFRRKLFVYLFSICTVLSFFSFVLFLFAAIFLQSCFLTLVSSFGYRLLFFCIIVCLGIFSWFRCYVRQLVCGWYDKDGWSGVFDGFYNLYSAEVLPKLHSLVTISPAVHASIILLSGLGVCSGVLMYKFYSTFMKELPHGQIVPDSNKWGYTKWGEAEYYAQQEFEARLQSADKVLQWHLERARVPLVAEMSLPIPARFQMEGYYPIEDAMRNGSFKHTPINIYPQRKVSTFVNSQEVIQYVPDEGIRVLSNIFPLCTKPYDYGRSIDGFFCARNLGLHRINHLGPTYRPPVNVRISESNPHALFRVDSSAPDKFYYGKYFMESSSAYWAYVSKSRQFLGNQSIPLWGTQSYSVEQRITGMLRFFNRLNDCLNPARCKPGVLTLDHLVVLAIQIAKNNSPQDVPPWVYSLITSCNNVNDMKKMIGKSFGFGTEQIGSHLGFKFDESGKWVFRKVNITPERLRLFQECVKESSDYQAGVSLFLTKVNVMDKMHPPLKITYKDVKGVPGYPEDVPRGELPYRYSIVQRYIRHQEWLSLGGNFQASLKLGWRKFKLWLQHGDMWRKAEYIRIQKMTADVVQDINAQSYTRRYNPDTERIEIFFDTTKFGYPPGYPYSIFVPGDTISSVLSPEQARLQRLANFSDPWEVSNSGATFDRYTIGFLDMF